MMSKTTPKTHTYRGEIIYVAYNPISRRYEQVHPEDQMSKTTIVSEMFWCQDIQRYITIPGTPEFKGYVPQGR